MIKLEALAADDSRFQMQSSFALQKDLFVGLASDHNLTFSDCFHAHPRNSARITKNCPFCCSFDFISAYVVHIAHHKMFHCSL